MLNQQPLEKLCLGWFQEAGWRCAHGLDIAPDSRDPERAEIKARARNNVVQEKKYGDRLLETLRKYHNRAIATAQVIEERIQMAKEDQADAAELVLKQAESLSNAGSNKA